MNQLHNPQDGITLDDLAVMVKGSFDAVDKRFDALERTQIETNHRLTGLEDGQKVTNQRLTALEDGQDQIKLRLDNVAYRFEINELNQRVDRIERHVGIV